MTIAMLERKQCSCTEPHHAHEWWVKKANGLEKRDDNDLRFCKGVPKQ